MLHCSAARQSTAQVTRRDATPQKFDSCSPFAFHLVRVHVTHVIDDLDDILDHMV